MNPKASSFLSLALFLAAASAVSAFNITRILDQHPDFSTFNTLLNQTKLYEQINHRQTITVLAVDNSAIGGLSGKPTDVVKKILSVHVVLDYYDVDKLKRLNKKSSILTTLFQSSGLAHDQQGFVNVTKLGGGEIVFGSAVKDANVVSKLVNPVAAQPYNISVLQISQLIDVPGIENGNTTVTHPPPPPPSPKSASPAPAPTEDDTSESPIADSPEADAPAPGAKAPEADTPASSPPEPKDAPADDAPAPSDSGSSRIHIGVAVVMGLMASLFAC